MGWSEGSGIAEACWKLVAEYIPEKDKKRIARKFVDIIRSVDCDTMDECTKLMKAADLPEEKE